MRQFINCVSFVLFLAGCACATDAQGFHAPHFKDEVQQLLNEQIKLYEGNLGKEIVNGAVEGFCMPWLGTFALGGFLSCKINHPQGVQQIVAKTFSGGIWASISLSPIALLLALPTTLVSMGYSSVKWLVDGVSAAKHEPDFAREVTVHLYHWIEVVKRGRLAIRHEIKEWQNHCRIEDKNLSLSEATNKVLNSGNFNKYFAETDWTCEDMCRLLHKIDHHSDNWEDFFNELSRLVRIPELSDKEWHALEQRLIHFPNRGEGCPQLSAQDIKEYLAFAVYFFTLHREKHVEMLKIYAKGL